MTQSRSEIRAAKPQPTGTLMSAATLHKWFDRAEPGERCMYYRGNLVWARHNRHHPDHHKTIELADEARRLGTPSGYTAGPRKSESEANKFGAGEAHLAQRRIEEDVYEYFITKSADVVLT